MNNLNNRLKKLENKINYEKIIDPEETKRKYALHKKISLIVDPSLSEEAIKEDFERLQKCKSVKTGCYSDEVKRYIAEITGIKG